MHPLSPKLNLLVCRISGRGLLSETFRETLPTLSCGRGEKEHRNNITCTSGSGTSFVFKGKLIQCRPVNEVLSFLYDLFTKGLSIRPSILYAQRYLIISWAKIYPIANFRSPVTHLLNATLRVCFIQEARRHDILKSGTFNLC